MLACSVTICCTRRVENLVRCLADLTNTGAAQVPTELHRPGRLTVASWLEGDRIAETTVELKNSQGQSVGSALAQNAETHELSDALEKLGQEAARLQTVIDTVPSFLWTSLPDGSKEYLNSRRNV
jgi:hypothetical protein